MPYPFPTSRQPLASLLAFALAVPLAGAMRPAGATPVVSRVETRSAGSLAGLQPIFAKDGVILSLLALFFQANPSSGGSQPLAARSVVRPNSSSPTPTPTPTPSSPSLSSAPGGQPSALQAPTPHDQLEALIDPQGSGATAATMASAVTVQAPWPAPVSSVSIHTPDPASSSGAVEQFSVSASGGSLGSSLTMVLAEPLRPQPLSLGAQGSGVLPGLPGSVTATPGPLPVAAALAGWQSARHLRRRCRRQVGPARRP
jgi:hypothetical protein